MYVCVVARAYYYIDSKGEEGMQYKYLPFTLRGKFNLVVEKQLIKTVYQSKINAL